MAATAPPRSSISRIRATAAFSISSVRDSIAYDPANGSTVLATSDS
jgi:hypothetical protein